LRSYFNFIMYTSIYTQVCAIKSLRSGGISTVLRSFILCWPSLPLNNPSALLSADVTLCAWRLIPACNSSVWITFHSVFTPPSLDFRSQIVLSVVLLSVFTMKVFPGAAPMVGSSMRPSRTATVSSHASMFPVLCAGGVMFQTEPRPPLANYYANAVRGQHVPDPANICGIWVWNKFCRVIVF
jgi:hypothetical protein